MLSEEHMTNALRSLAAELDALAASDTGDATRIYDPPDIPDFRLGPLLGRGGMGAVYRAEQVSLRREVAVKFVMDAQGGDFPEEARTVAQLHHPNIIQVYAAGRADGLCWFAMELAQGESADHHAFKSEEEVVRFGICVAEALAYAHRCGIVHRDVKPSNIFLGSDGSAKLGDFGLACLAAKTVSDGGGTQNYMAPELLAGAEATAASDQYALGVTLRELLDRAAHGTPPTPDFDAILSKATAPDPSSRYDGVESMLADLRRFLAHEPVVANPPSALRRFRLFARRNPLAASGIAAAALLLAAFVSALAVGYIKTSRALEATRQEAARAAQSLAATMTNFDRSERDPRDTELRRAQEVAEALAARFPEDETIKESVEAIRKARERRASLPKRPRRFNGYR